MQLRTNPRSPEAPSITRRNLLGSAGLAVVAVARATARSTRNATDLGAVTETGIASWYGHPFHGRVAANGEVYDMEKLTAAHRTLPFNTIVRVGPIGSGRSVDVRITDRGPFIEGRIIDLSRAAASAIHLIQPGIAPVIVTTIEPAAATTPGTFAVQVGAFLDRGNAERYVTLMKSHYGAAKLTKRDGDPAMWRVLVGVEQTEIGARRICSRVKQDLGSGSAFVVRLD